MDTIVKTVKQHSFELDEETLKNEGIKLIIKVSNPYKDEIMSTLLNKGIN